MLAKVRRVEQSSYDLVDPMSPSRFYQQDPGTKQSSTFGLYHPMTHIIHTVPKADLRLKGGFLSLLFSHLI